MAKIVGMEGINTTAQLQQEIQKGGKFVLYQYCISIIIMTFKRGSNIYFIPAGESRITPGLGFSALTFFFGWWGIPWGPIYTVQCLWSNFSGGKDVTAEVVAGMMKSAQSPQV